MARGDSLVRQLSLVMLLDQDRELSVPKAVERLGCARRTVYRDLEVLQQAGWPLYAEPQGRRVRWRLTEGFRRRLTVTLRPDEVIALSVGVRSLDAMEGTPFVEAAARALEKLRAMLVPDMRERVDALAKRLSVGVGARRDYGSRRVALEGLATAIEGSETVELTYRKLKARQSERYTIDPYQLHLDAGALYVFAWAHERRAARTFLLDRVSEVRRTGLRFERRPEMEKVELVHGAFGVWDGGPPKRVHLRFKGRSARVVAEKMMHPSQVNQWRSDRELDVTLRVPISPGLVGWVRSFGPEVAVAEPRDLEKEVRTVRT